MTLDVQERLVRSMADRYRIERELGTGGMAIGSRDAAIAWACRGNAANTAQHLTLSRC